MAPLSLTHFLIVGAGAAGLMTAREFARAGKKVTILEARDRCGGRIYPLSAQRFGYSAEGGAEFVHGSAPLTRALMREAGLSLVPIEGTRWDARNGAISPRESQFAHATLLHRALSELKTDLPVTEFLKTRFSNRKYAELRDAVKRMVEGYDAADPDRASTFAFRDEWTARGPRRDGRVAGGYGALIKFLVSECRGRGATIHLSSVVTAIEENIGRIAAYCDDGTVYEADAAILTVPLPILREISLPYGVHEKVTASTEIGFGSVVKILLRFSTKWLTGWFAGPKADTVARLTGSELVAMGLNSLAEIFNLPPDCITRDLITSQAINWSIDAFARGAYSYATPNTREAQLALRKSDASAVFFSGEALYAGRDMGTVEAALANGMETAQAILAAGQ
jgi:monoamine oxidase